MTTPVDTLRDTDAPLIAHVSNIPYESLEEHGLDRSSSQADGPGLGYDENGEPGDSSAETALSEEEIERRKRIYLRYKASVLDQAFKDIDLLVYIEYGIQYYMDCSLIHIIFRILIHLLFFSFRPGPLPSSVSGQPFVSAIFLNNLLLMFIHFFGAPVTPPGNSRGYLQGGLIIDFIGVKAPVSPYALLLVDCIIMACQILLMGITLEKVKIKRSLDKSSGVQEPEDDIIVEIRRASEQLLGGASSRAQTYDDEERGVLRGGTGSGGRRLGSVSSSSSSSDEEEPEPEERPQSRPPEQLSLRDMLLSEPTPEERARHESGSRESDPLIPSATSATAATRRSEHPLLRRLERLRRRQSQTPQEPQPFQPISPPYASPGRHPLDTLTHGVESILDFHVFDAIRRQWRHSTRSGFFTAPSVGVPRRTPVGGAPAAPGLSEWGGMVGNGLSNAFTRRPAEEAPRPT